jgi:hypothetical protein
MPNLTYDKIRDYLEQLAQGTASVDEVEDFIQPHLAKVTYPMFKVGDTLGVEEMNRMMDAISHAEGLVERAERATPPPQKATPQQITIRCVRCDTALLTTDTLTDNGLGFEITLPPHECTPPPPPEQVPPAPPTEQAPPPVYEGDPPAGYRYPRPDEMCPWPRLQPHPRGLVHQCERCLSDRAAAFGPFPDYLATDRDQAQLIQQHQGWRLHPYFSEPLWRWVRKLPADTDA